MLMSDKNKVLCSLSILFICFSCITNKTKESISKECITNVFKIDDSLGKVRNHECEVKTLSVSIKNYTEGLDKIDFSNCPSDFKTAFEHHSKAWKNMVHLTNKYDHLRGEMHTLFDVIEVSKDSIIFKERLKDIWDTWALVEKAASI